MTIRVRGPHKWGGGRDAEGHRFYNVTYAVTCLKTEGPATVLASNLLPQPGDIYSLDSDTDIWAFCKPNATVRPETEGQPNTKFFIDYEFTTKPITGDKSRCQDFTVEDPILEPPKLSGGFQKFTEEATRDRRGNAILSSSWEQFRGPQVEFDNNRPFIKVSHNVPLLEIELFSRMVDTVNDSLLWGFPRRCVKLSNVSWERKYYGSCSRYYTRSMDFEINARLDPDTGLITSGWDRDLLDEGAKVLNGQWDADGRWEVLDVAAGVPADPFNPEHFTRFKDKEDENARVILNGFGLPAGVVTSRNGLMVSITNGNVGNSLRDSTEWNPIANTLPLEWIGSIFFERGELITYLGVLYVAKRRSLGVLPTVAAVWAPLGASLTNRGDYSDADTYDLGDYVLDTTETVAGKIHVEKYEESNFYLLGIPSVIE